MKSKKMGALVVAAGVLLTSNNVNATGIPVVDVANLAQSVQQVLAWAEQYQQMATQIQNMQKNINTLKDIDASQIGSRGLGYIYNNPALTPYYSASWTSTLNNITTSNEYITARAKYPTSQVSETNHYYDTLAKEEALARKFHSSTQQRFSQISSLQSSINTSTDPAAKADLRNRIAIEEANIAASSAAFETMQRNMAAEKEQAALSSDRAYVCSQYQGVC